MCFLFPWPTLRCFFENFINFFALESSITPKPALSITTIDSQQHVKRRRASFFAAFCFSLSTSTWLLFFETDCSLCHSDIIWVAPTPPASQIMSIRVHRLLTFSVVLRLSSGLDARMHWYNSLSHADERYTNTPAFWTEVTNCCSDSGMFICP